MNFKIYLRSALKLYFIQEGKVMYLMTKNWIIISVKLYNDSFMFGVSSTHEIQVVHPANYEP